MLTAGSAQHMHTPAYQSDLSLVSVPYIRDLQINCGKTKLLQQFKAELQTHGVIINN
jgi:hypothetical protein